jgi:hypothetical protein
MTSDAIASREHLCSAIRKNRAFLAKSSLLRLLRRSRDIPDWAPQRASLCHNGKFKIFNFQFSIQT